MVCPGFLYIIMKGRPSVVQPCQPTSLRTGRNQICCVSFLSSLVASKDTNSNKKSASSFTHMTEQWWIFYSFLFVYHGFDIFFRQLCASADQDVVEPAKGRFPLVVGSNRSVGQGLRRQNQVKAENFQLGELLGCCCCESSWYAVVAQRSSTSLVDQEVACSIATRCHNKSVTKSFWPFRGWWDYIATRIQKVIRGAIIG